MTYNEAVEYAKSLMEDDLWIFVNGEGNYKVIRLVSGIETYNHYCKHYSPVACVKLIHRVIKGPM